MQIDWLTVIAQIANFLILVWLLKRFLYGPIIETMDHREQLISDRLEKASLRERDAINKIDSYEGKIAALDSDRKLLMEQARKDTEIRLLELLDNARREITDIGTVVHVGAGIARFTALPLYRFTALPLYRFTALPDYRITGLPSLTSEELVLFPKGLYGIASHLEPNIASIMLLGVSSQLTAGAEVHGTGRVTDTPVGDGLIGRVIDATGRVLDHNGPLQYKFRRPIERRAPSIMDRAPVTVPMETGIKAIDALIPIGRGQRELIVGDRQTGKTSVAVDTIINQRNKNVVCVYCAIGQRGTAVARVVDTLRKHGALSYTFVVVGAGEDPPGLQFITPYAATSMAEFFMQRGQDVLIVYDDLTRHARTYRELSLLFRRSPGREAYPGDIFYIHSRLLERCTRLGKKAGGGSLTALPVVETEAQDISAYIPTNLISITDGQIYLSPILFHKGHMPAIDVGKSVSRVGGKTQLPAFRAVAGDLNLAYAQFEELEAFARFSTRLDENTRKIIRHVRRVREFLKQSEQQPLRMCMQIAAMKSVTAGLLDTVPLEEVGTALQLIQNRVTNQLPELCEQIERGEQLHDDDWQQLLHTASDTLV